MILKYSFLIINFPKKILFFNEGKCKNFLEYLEMFKNEKNKNKIKFDRHVLNLCPSTLVSFKLIPPIKWTDVQKWNYATIKHVLSGTNRTLSGTSRVAGDNV